MIIATHPHCQRAGKPIPNILVTALLVTVLGCAEEKKLPQADAGTVGDAGTAEPDVDASGEDEDVDAATFVGDFDGEVHFQASSLGDSDEPDVAGFHESTITVALAGEGLDFTFAPIGGSVENEPPTCTLRLEVDGGIARLIEEQSCPVVVGNFEGTWTFESAALAVSESRELSFSAASELVQPDGYEAAFIYEVFGRPQL